MGIWIIFAVIIAGIAVASAASKGNRNRIEEEKTKDNWGKFQENEYTSEELENISSYYKLIREDSFFVDDITWNDLDMDRLYGMMDISRSSIGREYLYKTLRMPEFDLQKIKEFDDSAEWIDLNDKTRYAAQSKLERLGFVKNFSFADHIDAVQNLKPIGSGISILLDVLLAAAILFMIFVNAPAGIIIAVGIALVSTAVYFKKKPAIEPYFFSMSQVSRMVRTAWDLKDIKGDLKNAPHSLRKAVSDTERYSESLRGCIKGDWLIADSRSTGSPGEVFMNYIRMFTHVDILHYNRAIPRMHGKKKEITGLYESFGYLETLICVASFRDALKFYSFPELYDTDPENESSFELTDVIHPMIEDAVPNSIRIEKGDGKDILITGSNASGKSTFLKSVALNAILSQSIATSTSRSYKAPLYRIYSSMSLKDDLAARGSYYMVEIQSLKRIIDAAADDTGAPVICFVDEVLRGTNTVERIAASSAILENMSRMKALTFAATHDIELTYLLDKDYANYHFREEMTDSGVEFSYKILEGPATTRNAIALLDNLGYDKEIIEKAKARAESFMKTGIWR